MAGLKTLAKELQSKGRNGDTMLAHINPQEAGILKALGGSGTINPHTGLPEYWGGLGALNPFNPGSGLNKTINTTPIIGDINKAANKLGTQIFQPLEKAIVQPTSKGLSEFDKQVARTVPGGWATVAQVAASMVPGGQPLAIAIGAAKGAGLTRTGSSLQRADLKGAVIGGATAYAQSELGDYMRGAVPPGAEVGPALLPESVPITDYSTDILTGEFIQPPPPTVSPQFSFGPEAATPELLNADTGTGLGAGEYSGYTDVAPPNEPLVQLSGPGSIYDTSPPPSFLKRVGTKAGDTVSGTAKAIVEAPTTGLSGIAKTGEGVQNLLGLGDISRSEAIKLAAKTGIDPIKMAGIVIAGESTLAGMEEQRKYLEEAKKANAISQAEYDQALASIYGQRDYAADVVSKNPLTIPDIDVSGLGKTLYQSSSEPLYKSSSKALYAMGGSVDDELGGDYSAMGMDQGNLQKGLFGLGYAAGGQIDTGNSSNLPPMGGSLGAIGAQQTAQTQPSFAQSLFGSISPYADYANANTFGQSDNGLMSMFNQSAQQNTSQMAPNIDQNSNTNMGGFASPNSFYDEGSNAGSASYGGDNSNAFPLEGQYGIVKLAAGGMPRFLSGGGDGMSDSIKASINGTQEARLADGEFVIPADVVSHLGNGSSKAGAKQLYSMMDKIRKARTGRKSQGKQINPRKYLPA